MRRMKHVVTDFPQGDGWFVERAQYGSCIYWNVYRLDADGYVVRGTGSDNLASKAAAERHVRRERGLAT